MAFVRAYRELHKEANSRMLGILNLGKGSGDKKVRALETLSTYIFPNCHRGGNQQFKDLKEVP